VFAESSRQLYSSIMYDSHEMYRIRDDINRRLSSEQMSTDCFHSCHDVKDVVLGLEAHKSYGNSGLSSGVNQ
jgi:hypothetical protein